MSDAQGIDAIRARLSQAEAQRDAWLATGREEKYLEAYVMVEALVLQLEARTRRGDDEPASEE